MSEDAGDKDAKRASEDGPQEPSRASSQPPDPNEAAARAIPGLDRLRTVTDQLIINIGVLGDIQGGTVSATGQSSQPSLGDVISEDDATMWPVRQSELQRLHRVFLPVANVVEAANKILESRRVLVLHGRAYWGKAATAQWLLNQRHKERVFLVEPRSDQHLRELTNTLGSDGYLIDTLSAEHAPQLRASTLLKLSEHLQVAERGGHLVITVDALIRLPAELVDYLVVCQDSPKADDVLWRHLEAELAQDADEALSKARPWIRERLRHGPSPGRVRDLAAALATMIRNNGGLAEAKRDYQQRVLEYVEEWFQQHHGPRERCFMTAAAVLNGAAYQDVTNAADELERLVFGEITGTGPIPRGWSQPFSPRQQRVQDVGAKLLPSADGSSDGPLSTVQLEEPLVQAMVLAHLWDQHDDIVSHLFEWLDDLGRHPRFEVSGRAAAAASTLCAIGYTYLRRTLLEPWASDPKERAAQISAAVALAMAAREPKLTRQILALLQQWSSRGTQTGLPWTAATAFGLLDRKDFLPDALEGLRTITERHGRMLSWVVARSLVNLCEAGHAADTLGELRTWINAPSPTLADNARTVFQRLMRVRGDQPDSDSDIPVLLALATRDGQAAEAVGRLWHDLAGSPRPEVKKAALEALYDWFVLADTDSQCCPAVDAVLRPLLLQPATWQRTRRTLRTCAFQHKPGSPSARDLLRLTGTWLDNALDWIYAAWRSIADRSPA